MLALGLLKNKNKQKKKKKAKISFFIPSLLFSSLLKRETT